MLFDDAFIERIRNNPIEVLIEACDSVFARLETDAREWEPHEFSCLAEAVALVSEVVEAGLLGPREVPPDLSGNLQADCAALYKYLQELQAELQVEYNNQKFESLRGRFRAALGGSFHYEFTQGDLERVQDLISQLRTLIAESTLFDEKHQARLLRRLERLQSELHKRVSDVDRFWGLVGDAGVALGKFGEDAKPFVDRIKEIADIIWRTQARAEELPSGTVVSLLDGKISRSTSCSEDRKEKEEA